MKKIGILGSGNVAKTLALGFLNNNYKVMLGTRNPEKLRDWLKSEGKGAECGDFNQCTVFGEILVLALKGNIAQKQLESIPGNNLAGKTIIDATNPIADAPPENGVLKFFTGLDQSLMEMLQKTIPNANFVKAFNSVGSAYMVNPPFKPAATMFICGNDDQAKKEVKVILEQFGWEYEDMGKAESARAIEPLCMLWCIPGFLENRWSHAFKMIRL